MKPAPARTKKPAPIGWIAATAIVTCLVTLLLQAEYRRLSGPYVTLLLSRSSQAEAPGLAHFSDMGLSLASNGALPTINTPTMDQTASGVLTFGKAALPIVLKNTLKKYEADYRMSDSPTVNLKKQLLISSEFVESLTPEARKVMTARIEGGIYVCWLELKDLEKLPRDGVFSIIVN